jgi:hypothetical protein
MKPATRLALELMDAGLAAGEAADVIADARATIRSEHETLPLAAARGLRERATRVAAYVGDLEHAADLVAGRSTAAIDLRAAVAA